MRVFVSSTYRDLIDYRREVTKAVLDAGMEPILLEAISAGDEWFTTINNAIDRSDIFLIIIGFQAGIIFGETGKTFIEHEYEIAKEKKKPVLTFMLDDDVLIRTGDIDSNIDRALEFRNVIRSNFLVNYVSSPSNIYQKALLALLRLKDRVELPTEKEIGIEDRHNPKNNFETKNVRIIKLLLSSPGDVNIEREIVSKVVFRFNQEYLIEKGVFIKLIRWEDMAPQIANGPQKVVNKQLDMFDIFLGVMWNRFGTPTDLASSGTEEEFNDALSSWQTYNRPWITFYFCNRPINFTTAEQLEQKAKVLSFKQKVMSLGIIKSYDYTEEFENTVFHDLIKIVDKYLK